MVMNIVFVRLLEKRVKRRKSEREEKKQRKRHISTPTNDHVLKYDCQGKLRRLSNNNQKAKS